MTVTSVLKRYLEYYHEKKMYLNGEKKAKNRILTIGLVLATGRATSPSESWRDTELAESLNFSLQLSEGELATHRQRCQITLYSPV